MNSHDEPGKKLNFDCHAMYGQDTVVDAVLAAIWPPRIRIVMVQSLDKRLRDGNNQLMAVTGRRTLKRSILRCH
jgi:hypothetical protein